MRSGRFDASMRSDAHRCRIGENGKAHYKPPEEQVCFHTMRACSGSEIFLLCVAMPGEFLNPEHLQDKNCSVFESLTVMIAIRNFKWGRFYLRLVCWPAACLGLCTVKELSTIDIHMHNVRDL
ncbi:hypothetical protein PoB_006890100 [Plakobranchus ocellatus]|uniref:Uncharacterized protein n=1 Tax=Plakobranchus ocellatus TaxID=259542 RepID=A0AAV4DE53_9GAST|nr:hypothetical protein PoB_006890100 [Plakobranchus ocellatus]